MTHIINKIELRQEKAFLVFEGGCMMNLSQ